MAFTRKAIGGLCGVAASAVASFLFARGSIPKPPDPPPLDHVLTYILSGQDGLANAGLVCAAISAFWATYQMFQSPPMDKEAAEDLVARDGDATRIRVSEEAAGTADLIRAGHRMQAGDIVDRVEAAVEAKALDPFQRERLRTLADRIEADTGAAPRAAEMAAQTALRLGDSNEPAQRAVAERVKAGDLLGAAKLRAQAAESSLVDEQQRAAGALRDAGYLALPVSPSQALDYFRRATELDPTDAWLWIEKGRLCLQYEGIDAARKCYARALEHVVSERDRAVLDNELGEIEIWAGNLAKASEHFEKGLAIAERLAADDPDNPEWQRDLSVSLGKLGDVERASGNLVRARERYEAWLVIAERLAADEPNNEERQRDLSVSLNKLGDVERASGNLGKARDRYEAGLLIRETLVRLETGNNAWRRDLSVSLNKLGDVEKESDNLEKARDHYEAGLVIREALAEQEPGNSAFQRDLTVSFERLGDVERESDNLEKARDRYQEGLLIRERLAEQDPGNSAWRRDLTVSFNKLGDIEMELSNLAEARDRYEAGLLIREALAEQEPGNGEWQRDLSISLAKLALCAELRGARGEAIGHLERAEAILGALVARQLDHPGFASDLALTRARLAQLREA